MPAFTGMTAVTALPAVTTQSLDPESDIILIPTPTQVKGRLCAGMTSYKTGIGK
jgi:hypothetical protein